MVKVLEYMHKSNEVYSELIELADARITMEGGASALAAAASSSEDPSSP